LLLLFAVCCCLLFAPAITSLIVMSSSDDDKEKDKDKEFDIKAWFVDSRISDAGLKKLLQHEVRDIQSLLLMSSSDVSSMKLAAADKAKFVCAVDALRPKKLPRLEGDSDSPRENPGPVHVEQIQDGGESVNLPVQPSQFSLAEVAGFLAGRPIPENLSQTIVNLGHQETLNRSGNANFAPNLNVPPPSLSGRAAVGAGVGVNPSHIPVLPPSLQQAFAGLSLFDQTGVPSYERVQNVSAQQPLSPQNQYQQGVQNQSLQYPQGVQNQSLQYPQSPPYQSLQYPQTRVQSQVPSYTSPLSGIQQAQIPSRQNTLHSLNRDSYLQSQASGYQQSSYRDNQTLNSCLPVKPGENLFLPVNFCSHLRGHRTEDEEIMCTENGTKLILSNPNNKKITPDKLNQGLFLGANARILARIIPNLTPEVADYLDYLRKIGDFLVNYTSTSVYNLDHEHRFEICEKGGPYNFIDPSLSLNWLKKKDVAQNQSQRSHGTNASKSSNVSKSQNSNSNSKQSGAPCWQYNQPSGCQFEPNCRYPHFCNVPGCKGEHPSFKHVFKYGNKSTSSTQQSAQSP